MLVELISVTTIRLTLYKSLFDCAVEENKEFFARVTSSGQNFLPNVHNIVQQEILSQQVGAGI